MSWPDDFEDWLENASRIAYWYIYRRLRSHFLTESDARDVAEQAITNAHLKAHQQMQDLSFPNIAAFRGWFRLVAWREAIPISTKRSREQERIESADVGGIRDARGHGGDLRLDLQFCMAKLNVSHREIVMLYMYEGRTFQEIADLLGFGTATAFLQFRAALARLRQCMLSYEP